MNAVFVWLDNAGRASGLFRLPKESADWIITESEAGMAGIRTSS